MSFIFLEIYTPTRKVLSRNVDFISVQTDNYRLGILPKHAPLVATVAISELVLTMDGKKFHYAVGGGLLNIQKDKTILLLDSIEKSDAIDIERAKRAKIRAEERLKNKSSDLDVKRAELALKRALNRINVSSR